MSSKKQNLIERLMLLGQTESMETALFHQMAAESFGMGITDMKAISALMLEGPMSAGNIAKRLHITTGAVTNLVDRLEGRGMVRRVADDKDRRKVIIQATPPDPSSFKNDPYTSMGKAYASHLMGYTEKELEFLIGYHQKQIEITKGQIDGF